MVNYNALISVFNNFTRNENSYVNNLVFLYGSNVASRKK